MAISLGANVNCIDKDLNTPLHLVLKESLKNFYVIIDDLINYKADLDAVDKFNRTPLHYACMNFE